MIIYLNENRVNELDVVAHMAEDFSLTHKPNATEGQRKNIVRRNISPQPSPPTGDVNDCKKARRALPVPARIPVMIREDPSGVLSIIF